MFRACVLAFDGAGNIHRIKEEVAHMHVVTCRILQPPKVGTTEKKKQNITYYLPSPHTPSSRAMCVRFRQNIGVVWRLHSKHTQHTRQFLINAGMMCSTLWYICMYISFNNQIRQRSNIVDG